jgi:amino acid permease
MIAKKEAGASGSTCGGFINFFKQMFGAGVLALPHAFTWAGLGGGILGYVVVLVCCCYSQVLLVICLAKANKKQEAARELDILDREAAGGAAGTNSSSDAFPKPIGTYVELAGFVLGAKSGVAVGWLVIILEMCFCAGWVIVACQNIGVQTGLHHSYLAWVLFPIVALLCCIPFLSDLWPLSFVGLAVYLGGVMGTLYYHIGMEAAAGRMHPDLRGEAFKWSTLPSFIGTAVYGLEAVLMVIPVTASLRYPESGELFRREGPTHPLLCIIVYYRGRCGPWIAILHST